jgi:hypothetical protein
MIGGFGADWVGRCDNPSTEFVTFQQATPGNFTLDEPSTFAGTIPALGTKESLIFQDNFQLTENAIYLVLTIRKLRWRSRTAVITTVSRCRENI